MAIYYIARYLAHHHPELSAEPNDSAEMEPIRRFFGAINRGGLSHPYEHRLYLVLLCYFFFANAQETNCRKRLVNILNDFAPIFKLDLTPPIRALRRIVNILMKNFTSKFQHKQRDQQRRKIAKLTSPSC
ncbi:hypothetical protein ElyMa_004248200 [Elysia marginata]|uniref:Uncharacterized protein n=1 Tax=Elysia marginata TaxID=1093978 RepID=A0AAV4GSZ3_9GAST|nr:hypothetical protein ElyMa_004248200 [Elysia marginata]